MEITSTELPGATFYGHAALRRHAADRLAYETAVRKFETDRDPDALADTLGSIGYESDEIAPHVATPGWRLPEVFL